MTEDKTREQHVEEIKNELLREFSSLIGHSQHLAREALDISQASGVAHSSSLKGVLIEEKTPVATVELLEFTFHCALNAEESVSEVLKTLTRIQSLLNMWNAVKLGPPSQFIRYDRGDS